MKVPHLVFTLFVASIPQALSSITYAFFVNLGLNLKTLQVKGIGHSPGSMVWGRSFTTPSEFFYIDGCAHSSNATNPGFIVADLFDGFFFEALPSGSVLRFDGQKRVTNAFFYSCGDIDGVDTIETVHKFGHCSHVELYFLPYNRTSKAPVKGSFTLQQMVQRIPYVFYVEGRSSLEPLYTEKSEPLYENLVPFNHGNREAKPLEFYIQENYAITDDGGEFSGYAAFKGDHFGFNRHSGDTKLQLDSNMKLLHRSFYSCMDSKTHRRIIVCNPLELTACHVVQMYLLPYNRTTGLPVEGSYTPRKGIEVFYWCPKVTSPWILPTPSNLF